MKNLNLIVRGLYAGSRIQNLPHSRGILFVYKNIEFTNEFKVYSSEGDKSNLYLSLKDIKYCDNIDSEVTKMLNDVELIPNERYKNIAFAYSLCDINAEFILDLVQFLKNVYINKTLSVQSCSLYNLKIEIKIRTDEAYKYIGFLLDNSETTTEL